MSTEPAPRPESEQLAWEEHSLSQLRYFRSLSLREKMVAVQGMADVVRRFLPSSLIKREELDPGILACLEARDDCRGLEIIISRINRVRDGGFFADFFNFERHTTITGWRFNATVLFVNDLVVYRSWGGQPKVNETENTRNPLGPLQGIGG